MEIVLNKGNDDVSDEVSNDVSSFFDSVNPLDVDDEANNKVISNWTSSSDKIDTSEQGEKDSAPIQRNHKFVSAPTLNEIVKQDLSSSVPNKHAKSTSLPAKISPNLNFAQYASIAEHLLFNYGARKQVTKYVIPNSIGRPPESKAMSKVEQPLTPTDLPKTNDLNTKCTPKKNTVFFKTHKCATSTVQNIMFRYGDKHQLRFVLPKSKRDHRFSLREPFSRRQVLTSGRMWSSHEQFNIFTNHAIFDKEGKLLLFPLLFCVFSLYRKKKRNHWMRAIF